MRLVATEPKGAHIAGKATIVERLVVDVAYAVEGEHTFDHALFAEAFEAIRTAMRDPVGSSVATREGYDVDALLAALDEAHTDLPTDDASLARLAQELESTWREDVLLGEERWRAKHPRPLDHALRGLRAYGAPDALQPDINLVVACLEAQLRERHVQLPGYREIYFQIGQSVEAARRKCSNAERWYCEVPTVLDASASLERSEHARHLQILDALEDALLHVSELDHLDGPAIRAACEELRRNGFEREVGLLSAENATYRALVFHEARPVSGVRHRFCLRVVNKRTGQSALRELGVYQTTFAAQVFGRMQLTKAGIRVSARPSESAQISRRIEQAPERWEYAMTDLFPSV